jgi:hypothetical protein
VLEGTLNISLEKAGHSVEVTAGQCVSPKLEESLDPIEDLVVSACE